MFWDQNKACCRDAKRYQFQTSSEIENGVWDFAVERFFLFWFCQYIDEVANILWVHCYGKFGWWKARCEMLYLPVTMEIH